MCISVRAGNTSPCLCQNWKLYVYARFVRQCVHKDSTPKTFTSRPNHPLTKKSSSTDGHVSKLLTFNGHPNQRSEFCRLKPTTRTGIASDPWPRHARALTDFELMREFEKRPKSKSLAAGIREVGWTHYHAVANWNVCDDTYALHV